MNEQKAITSSKDLGIAVEHIVREEYEMIILKKLFGSELGKVFVFKGGTALRLAYDSPRFSEDLDFSVIGEFDKKELDILLKSVVEQSKSLTLVETRQKKYTYFALFKIKESYIKQSLSIKFEASIRSENWGKEKDYKLQTLNSRVTNLTVLAQVATLNRLEKDKKGIPSFRIRDVFDLWFIGQKLNKPKSMDFSNWEAKTVKRELHKFLGFKDRRLIDQWLLKD